ACHYRHRLLQHPPQTMFDHLEDFDTSLFRNSCDRPDSCSSKTHIKKIAANPTPAAVTATAPPIRMSSSVAGSFMGVPSLRRKARLPDKSLTQADHTLTREPGPVRPRLRP